MSGFEAVGLAVVGAIVWMTLIILVYWSIENIRKGEDLASAVSISSALWFFTGNVITAYNIWLRFT